jgi:hypothetical protein
MFVLQGHFHVTLLRSLGTKAYLIAERNKMGDQKSNTDHGEFGMINTVKLANNMAQAQAHLQRIQADLAAFNMDQEGPLQMDPLNLGETSKPS